MEGTRVKPEAEKLGALDKWRARVLLAELGTGEPNSASPAGWAKKIERRLAVLKVAFPFLTERQLRGKAWQSCGLTSVMGGLPRFGLSPQIKREFTKHNQSRFKMAHTPRIKKEIIKTETECPYDFTLPKPEFQESQSNDEVMDTSFSSVQVQLSGTNALSSDNGSFTINNKKKLKRVHFNILENQKHRESSYIVPEISNNAFSSPNSQPYFDRFQNVAAIPTVPGADPSCFSQSNGSNYTSTQAVSNQTLSNLHNEVHLKSIQDVPLNLINSETSSSSILVTNPIYTNAQRYLINNENNECAAITSNQSHIDQLQKHFPPPNYINYKVINQQNPRTKQACQRSAVVLNINENFNSQDQILGELEIHNPFVDVSQLHKFNSSGLDCNNCYPGLVTPVQNKIIDAKEKISVETIAEVHHKDSAIVEKNKVPENYLKDQNLCTPYKLLPADVENYSVCSSDSLDYIQKTAEEYSKNIINYENLEICATPSRTRNIPVHLNKLKLYNLKHAHEVYELPDSAISNSSKSLTLDEKLLYEAKVVNSELYGQKLIKNHSPLHQKYIVNNDSQCNEFLSQNIFSLPLTPANFIEYKLPPNALLSNYCSEQERAYAKENLKPTLYRNYYSKIIQCLKDDFDKVIPPDKSLKVFFEAPGKSFEQVKDEVDKQVKNILLMLEREND